MDQSIPSEAPRFVDRWGASYRLIAPCSFVMGNAQVGAGSSETPAHEVSIQEPFFLGERLVTQAQWVDLMKDNPSKFQSGWSAGLRPVESVNIQEIIEFLSRLNESDMESLRFGLRGEWRLPTEAEWECAARAGTISKWPFGDIEAELNEHAWYAGNSGGSTREVGLKKPNGWGFYDMNGLVSEWCADHWHADYSQQRTQQPYRKQSYDTFVIRGGSWFTESESTRNCARSFAHESKKSDGIGFRLVWSPHEPLN